MHHNDTQESLVRDPQPKQYDSDWPVPMDSLPPECREHFLLFLMPEDIGSLSLVSRWWFETMKDEILWRTVFLRAFGSLAKPSIAWKDTCANAFKELYSVLKTEETTFSNSNASYKKIADFILGGNYTQEEVQGLSRLSTLPLLVEHVAKAGHFAVLKRIALHLLPRTFRSFLLPAFLRSSEGGHISILEWLLYLNPSQDVNHIFQTASGQYTTALLAACQSNSLSAAQFLLQKGAKVTVSSREYCLGGPGRRRGWRIVSVPCPVTHAISHGFAELAKMLILHCVNSNGSKAEKTRVLQGYLEQAAHYNHKEIAEFLLDQKEYCSVNGQTGLSASDGVSIPLTPPKNEDGTTPTAVNNNNEGGVLKLSAVGPALFQAAMQGHIEMAKFLIEKGADVNLRTTQRRAALHVSCYYGTTDFVKLLLDNGAELDTKTIDGATPLSVASWKGHKAVMEVLQQELAKRKGKG